MQAQTTRPPSYKRWLKLYRWCGISGYVLVPFNVLAAYEWTQAHCLIGWFEGLWPLGFPWALLTFACLAVKDSTPQHRVYRLGLVLGLATWVAPIFHLMVWRFLA